MERLLSYTEATTRLGKKDDKGISLREHLEQAKLSGADPEELRNVPELCSYTRRLWYFFVTLRNSTPSGFNGASHITQETIRNTCLNTGVKINKRDLKTLSLIDLKYLEVTNGK